MYNLLTDPFLPAVVDGRERKLTLPGVLALLSAGDINEFPGLAAHQRQSLFHFLVQTASISLHRADFDSLPADEETWRNLLAGLTPGHAETAWSLIAEEPTSPAFMQPPTAQAFFERMKPIAVTPDELDLLQTAKNHDLKAAKMAAPLPHLWVYALLSLQTMQGYSGRDQFGIARMNGGFASRVLAELVPSMEWGARFRRGIHVALSERANILARGIYFSDSGTALLWMEPWDEEESLSLAQLDPYFVEICRRIRLVSTTSGSITAMGRPSKVARVFAKDAKGALDDPWTPQRVGKDEMTALTVGRRGFDYRRVAEVLFDEVSRLPSALRPRKGDSGEMLLHLAVMVRGQGKTEGLHDRVVPVGPKVMSGLFNRAARQSLNSLARDMIGDVDKVMKGPLRIGLLTLLQAPDVGQDIDFQDDRARSWLDRFDREVDAVFFEYLNRIYEEVDEARQDERRAAWRNMLHALARDVFQQAMRRSSPPGARRERGRAMADNIFQIQMKRALPSSQPQGVLG